MSQSCVYTIRQGKRKGRECGKKVSKSDTSNQFCCAHLKSSQVSTDKLDKFHQSIEEDDEYEEDVGPFNKQTFSAPEVAVESDDTETDDDVSDVAELEEDSCEDDGIDDGFDMCEVIDHLQLMMKMNNLKQVKNGIAQLLTYCKSV